MGISTPVENTPSLALGTFEVKVVDMAAAYSAIANGGYATWPHAIKEVYTRDGYQLYQREADTENRILDAGAVKDLTKMLEKVISQGTGRRAKIPGFAAGKPAPRRITAMHGSSALPMNTSLPSGSATMTIRR